MGTFKTMMEVPVWGDEEAEILQDAFVRIKQHFDDLGFKLHKQELIFGCFCAIEELYPPKPRKIKKYPGWGRVSNENYNPPTGEK